MRFRNAAVMLLAMIAATLPARAAGPVLHEYFEPDPSDDLRLKATTAHGAMPAAINTPSGILSGPGDYKETPPSRNAYGGNSTPESVDATYRIDRDTSRPESVSYDDPFTPSVAPYKRLYAYDMISEGLELVVRDKALRRVPIGGAATPAEDQFYAELLVDLSANVPVRIPTPGPDTRVLAAHLEPQLDFELLRDGADNFFILARERRRARLLMQLSVVRAVFGNPFGNADWSILSAHASPVPELVRAPAAQMLAQIGISRAMPPREAVSALVAYFRSFAASSEWPQGRSTLALYRELVTAKKGVCRHRSYAFTITALALGIPTRFVRNEAHAWVEVFDGALWHRVDLGGAAGRLDFEFVTAQSHLPPADPYPWPQSSESGASMAERALTSARGAPGPGGPQSAQGSQAPSGAQGPTGARGPSGAGLSSSQNAGRSSTTDSSDNSEAERNERIAAPTALTLAVGSDRVLRGAPLEFSGSVEAGGEPCAFARVDIDLEKSDGDRRSLGALPTDAEGRFLGELTVPLSIAVGNYMVTASTPGTALCGPGQSRRTSQ